MATNYPDGYDSLTNPAGTDALSSPAHASQHADANDAIEAIQATLGLNPEGAYANVDARLDALVTDAAAAASSYADAASASAGSALASAGSAAAAAGTAYSYQQGAETNANQAALSAGSAYTSMLAAAASESAAAISAGAAATSAASIEAYADLPVEFRQFAADGSVLANLPARVHPAEQLLKQAVWWIDAAHSSASGQSVSNLGWGGSALDAQVGSSGSADSNDPKYLDWDGENYIYLPGVAGNYLSVPDADSLTPTAGLDVRCYAVLDDYSNGAFQRLVAKFDGYSANAEYAFGFNALGGLVLGWSTTGNFGVTGISRTATAAHPFADGTGGWFRATLSFTTGDVNFYTSTDGASWAQVGSTVAGAGATSIYNGTSRVLVGAAYSGTAENLAGKIHRAQVLDGINGTTVLDVDCSQISSGADTSFTALTGQTVTINRSTSGRKTVGVVHPRWLFGTDDYMEVADNDLIDFGATDSFTVLAVVRQWATPFNFSYPFGKHNDGVAGYYLRNNGTGTSRYAGISDGTNQAITTADYVDYTLGQVSVAGIRLDRSSQELSSFNGSDISTAASTSAVGSLANSLTFRVGNRSAGGFFTDAEFTAAAIWRRALTSGEIATLNSYFQGRA